MSSAVTSERWKLRVQGKKALGDELKEGLREYEKGLPYLEQLPQEKLRELRNAIKSEYNTRQKIRSIIVPDGNAAVVAAQEIMDVIRLHVHGDNDLDYIAETVFQTDAETIRPLSDLLGIGGEKSDSEKKYNGNSKSKITWNYRS